MAEVNKGYVEYIRSITPAFVAPIILTPAGKLRHALAYVTFLAYSLFLVIFARIIYYLTPGKPTYDPANAMKFIPELLDQFPFHLYPLLTKALSLDLLLNDINIRSHKEIVEIAIGEGSFSKRVFDGSNVFVYGFDINPYSLDKAEYSNLKSKVIVDGFNIPLLDNSAEIILSNNFLHHVTNKEAVLENWSRKADLIIFNENTNYWLSGQTKIYLLRLFGFNKKAGALEDQICSHGMKSLCTRQRLDDRISSKVNIDKNISYYSEFTHFLAMNYSFIYSLFVQPNLGPPTPETFKKMFANIYPLNFIMRGQLWPRQMLC